MIYALLFEMNNPFSSQYQCQACGTLMESVTNQISLCQHISQCKLRPLIDKSRIESIPKEYDYLISLCILCWDEDPKKRPSFEEIVEVIETEMSKQKCYSIIQVSVKNNTYYLRPLKLLLMKPKIEFLRNQIEKKFSGSNVVSLWYDPLQLNIVTDEDVLKMVQTDPSPSIIVEFDKVLYATEEISAKKEDLQTSAVKTEEFEKLRKKNEELENELSKTKIQLDWFEKEHSVLKNGIEGIVSHLKSKKEKDEIAEESSDILDRLTSLLFSDF